MVFPLVRCIGCALVYTAQIPAADQIGAFYKSESYDSHRVDNKSIISRIYRLVRSWNIKKKMRLVSRFTKTGVVVDYGCGLGHLAKKMKTEGFDVSGFEIDADVRALAKQLLDVNIEPLERFRELRNNSVDLFMMWHVLEHVYDLKSDFQQIVDKVKPNGVLLIAVPNFKAYDAKYYKKDWEAYDVPRHLYHFDKESINAFCSSFSLKRESIIPMRFDSYYVSMRSEKNKKAGGFVLRGVWMGFLSNLLASKYGYSSHIYVYRKK
jgi:SAM-dependent methyltransferase